jgi:mannose-6-phosphate isomerase-like protein (cupin superfamily)
MIMSGSGTVVGGTEERLVHPGDVVAYDVDELHGMRAGEEQLVIVAVIAPRPGAR